MINKYVRSCIQNTKKAMPDYFKKCLQQRLKNGIGSTTECETVDEMENRLMTANWTPWIDIENVLSSRRKPRESTSRECVNGW